MQVAPPNHVRHIAAKLGAVFMALPHTAAYRVMRRLSLTLLAARAAVLVALICLLIVDAAISRAHAQTSTRAATAPNYEAAYNEALMCWRATLTATHEWPDKRAWFEESSKVPFNAVFKLGHLLGYNNNRMTADLDTPAQTMEELNLHRNAGLLAQKISECQSLGLALR